MVWSLFALLLVLVPKHEQLDSTTSEPQECLGCSSILSFNCNILGHCTIHHRTQVLSRISLSEIGSRTNAKSCSDLPHDFAFIKTIEEFLRLMMSQHAFVLPMLHHCWHHATVDASIIRQGLHE